MRTIGDTSKWWKNGGDDAHRLNYKLNENSVVLDLGAYEGWFVEKISEKFGSKIFCFEPIVEYYNALQNKFAKIKNVFVFPFAVSNKNESGVIYFNGNASSTHIKTSNSIVIEYISLSQIMGDNDINEIDLIKINIEGDEYPLFEDMIKNNLVEKCDNIQVQFHVHIGDYKMRYDNIERELMKTHRLTYRYPFVWENWKRI